MMAGGVRPDVAILHTRFWIEGEVMHDALSQEDRESVGTRVLRKIDGRWHIVATQNTDVRHGRSARPEQWRPDTKAK
jgi:hypothetical protein